MFRFAVAVLAFTAGALNADATSGIARNLQATTTTTSSSPTVTTSGNPKVSISTSTNRGAFVSTDTSAGPNTVTVAQNPPGVCGGELEPCCAGSKCDSAGLVCRSGFNVCQKCGGRLQPVCGAPSAPCGPGLRSVAGFCATNFGSSGSPPPTVTPPPPGSYGGPKPPPPAPAPVPPAPTPVPTPTPTPTPRSPPVTCGCSSIDCGEIGKACCTAQFSDFTVGVCKTGSCLAGSCIATNNKCLASTAVGGSCVSVL